MPATTLYFDKVKKPKDMMRWFLGHPLVEWVELKGDRFEVDLANEYDARQLQTDLTMEFGVFVEGTVSAAQSEVAKVLNAKVQKISELADEYGFNVDSYFVRDLDRGDRIAGKVELEVKVNDDKVPQVIEITVYDSDDIVAEVPPGIADKLRILNYVPMKNTEQVGSFIRQFVEKAKGDEPREPDDQE